MTKSKGRLALAWYMIVLGIALFIGGCLTVHEGRTTDLTDFINTEDVYSDDLNINLSVLDYVKLLNAYAIDKNGDYFFIVGAFQDHEGQTLVDTFALTTSDAYGASAVDENGNLVINHLSGVFREDDSIKPAKYYGQQHGPEDYGYVYVNTPRTLHYISNLEDYKAPESFMQTEKVITLYLGAVFFIVCGVLLRKANR